MKSKKIFLIFVICLVVIAMIYIYYLRQNNSHTEKGDSNSYKSEEQGINSNDIEINNEDSLLEAPENLALPFDIENMGKGNEFFSPFGLIRHDRDKGYGHAGIDIPLSKGDNIYAVSDGIIIINEPSIDGGESGMKEGNNVVLLIKKGRTGEGWGFLYEHMNLNSEMSVGSRVNKKQLIGKSALSYGNNHLGLIYYFNGFKYTRDPKCWIEHLNDEDKQRILDAWEEIKSNSKFMESWKNAFENGAYPYRALLNKNNFPTGPQLCYEYGLDVREMENKK